MRRTNIGRSFFLFSCTLATGLVTGLSPVIAFAADTAVAAETAETIPDAARQQAELEWKQRCATCHGDTGKGDGAAAAALTPKPRDFTLDSWQSSVTDEHIEKVIAEGGQAVGLSMLMPGNPDLAPKPDVIKALRAHVRSLRAK